MWWFLANIVLVMHVLLFLFLGVAVIMAAMGWMRCRRKLALAFWPTMVITLAGLAIPGCALSDLERWLRQMVEPGWSRDMQISCPGFVPKAIRVATQSRRKCYEFG